MKCSIKDFTGNSLNEKWDDFCQNLTKGNRYHLEIPPPDVNEAGAIETSPGIWNWKIDAPIYFDDPENLGTILISSDFIVTEEMDAAFVFSPTNKTEDVYFPYGIPHLDCNGKAKKGLLFHGGSRIAFGSVTKIRNCETAVYLTDDVASCTQIYFDHLYSAFWSKSIVHAEGVTSSAVVDVVINQMWGERPTVSNTNGFVGRGNVSRLDVRSVCCRIAPNQMANGVLLEATSAGRPNICLNFGVIDVAADTGLRADSVVGSTPKIQQLKIGQIIVHGGTTAAYLDWCYKPLIEDWYDNGKNVVIGSNTNGAQY